MKKPYLIIVLAMFSFNLNYQAQISFALTHSVCASDSVVLVANLNAYPATSFSWTSQPSGAVFSSPGNSITNLSFTNSATYTITLMASVGNSTAFATNTIQVHPNPLLVISASSGTICSGQNATLIATGASSYTWVPSAGLIIAYSGTAHVSPGTTSIYSVSGSNGWGCMAEATSTIVFSSFPTLATISTASSVCAGSTATITAFGANSYTWMSSQFLNPKYQQTVSVAPGTFTLLGSNGGLCRDSILVTIGLSPPLDVSIQTDRTFICKDGGDTLVPIVLTANGANTYEWMPYQPGLMTYSIGQVTAVSPTISTCYTLTGSSADCKNSATLCIQVQTCESITENSNTESILIYPNPVTENLYLANTFYSEISVEVYDIYGKCILKKFSKIPHEAYLQINFSDFVKGIYLVKVLHKNKLVQSSKIIKE